MTALEYLDRFIDGYAVCALWSSNDPEKETPLDDEYAPGDINAETMAAMRKDCAAFIAANADDLEQFGLLTGRDADSMGHDYWLDRNGHGAGFFDRYLEIDDPKDREDASLIGKRLSEAAGFDPVELLPLSERKVGI